MIGFSSYYNRHRLITIPISEILHGGSTLMEKLGLPRNSTYVTYNDSPGVRIAEEIDLCKIASRGDISKVLVKCDNYLEILVRNLKSRLLDMEVEKQNQWNSHFFQSYFTCSDIIVSIKGKRNKVDIVLFQEVEENVIKLLDDDDLFNSNGKKVEYCEVLEHSFKVINDSDTLFTISLTKQQITSLILLLAQGEISQANTIFTSIVNRTISLSTNSPFYLEEIAHPSMEFLPRKGGGCVSGVADVLLHALTSLVGPKTFQYRPAILCSVLLAGKSGTADERTEYYRIPLLTDDLIDNFDDMEFHNLCQQILHRSFRSQLTDSTTADIGKLKLQLQNGKVVASLVDLIECAVDRTCVLYASVDRQEEVEVTMSQPSSEEKAETTCPEVDRDTNTNTNSKGLPSSEHDAKDVGSKELESDIDGQACIIAEDGNISDNTTLTINPNVSQSSKYDAKDVESKELKSDIYVQLCIQTDPKSVLSDRNIRRDRCDDMTLAIDPNISWPHFLEAVSEKCRISVTQISNIAVSGVGEVSSMRELLTGDTLIVVLKSGQMPDVAIDKRLLKPIPVNIYLHCGTTDSYPTFGSIHRSADQLFFDDILGCIARSFRIYPFFDVDVYLGNNEIRVAATDIEKIRGYLSYKGSLDIWVQPKGSYAIVIRCIVVESARSYSSSTLQSQSQSVHDKLILVSRLWDWEEFMKNIFLHFDIVRNEEYSVFSVVNNKTVILGKRVSVLRNNDTVYISLKKYVGLPSRGPSSEEATSLFRSWACEEEKTRDESGVNAPPITPYPLVASRTTGTPGDKAQPVAPDGISQTLYKGNEDLIDRLLALGFAGSQISGVLSSVSHKLSVDEVCARLFEDNSSPTNSEPQKPALVIPRELSQFDPTTCERLLQMGFSSEDIADCLENGPNRSVEDVVNILNGDGKQCAICLSNYSVTEMYTINCISHHRICYSCIASHLRSCLTNTDSNQMHIPACPMPRCNFVLEEIELYQLVKLCGDRGVGNHLAAGEIASLSKNVTDLYMAKLRRENGCIQCMNCCKIGQSENSWFQAPMQDGNIRKIRVQCPNCRTTFCGRCNASPYHYHCECDHLVQVSQDFLQWITAGRDRYATYYAEKNLAFQNAQHAYQQKKLMHEKEVVDARARLAELETNEQWKAQHCKCCPSCGRCINKLDGCDSMKCGHDYHGGNIQNGCGASFNWSAAPRYQANVGQMNQVAALTEEIPTSRDLTQHMISPDIPLLCDNCQNAIEGARLKCVHCPSLDICFNCSLSLNHDSTHVFSVTL